MTKDCSEDYLRLIKEKNFGEVQKILSDPTAYLDIDFQDEHDNSLLHLSLAQFVECSIETGFQYHEVILNYLLDLGFNRVSMLIQENDQGLNPIQYMYDLCKKSINPDYTFLWDSIEIIEQKLPVYFTGIKVTDNFNNFVLISKNGRKKFHIPDADALTLGDNVTLHRRLKKTKEHFETSTTNANKLVANIGFLVSTHPYLPKQARNEHYTNNRKFITIPIIDSEFITRKKPGAGIHSEMPLFELLCDEGYLRSLCVELTKQLGDFGRKIYTLVFDIFSENEMCGNCNSELFRTLGANDLNAPIYDFLTRLENHLSLSFHLPKQKQKNPFEALPITPYKLPCIVRYSALYKCHFFSYQPEQRLGILSKPILKHQKNILDDEINVKHMGRRVIFHSTVKYDSDSLSAHTYHSNSAPEKLSIYKNTVFISGGAKNGEKRRKVEDKTDLYTSLKN